MITTSSREKDYIAAVAERLQAKRILEIGAFKGQTTARLAEVARKNGGYVVVVDPMQWASTPASLGEYIDTWLHRSSYEPAFRKNTRQFSNVHLHKNLSTDIELIASTHTMLREFDLVFIDGEHTEVAVRRDFETWGSRVRPGGCVLLHDVRPRFPGVLKFFEGLSANASYVTTPPKGHSVGTVDILAPVVTASARKSARA